MQKFPTKPHPRTVHSPGRGYSNLIFDSPHQEAHRSASTSCSHRSNSVLMLSDPRRKENRCTSMGGFSRKQMLEVNKGQRINVIDLLNGNNAMVPKLKSNYCKKITLSNLNKYYEHCLNTVRQGLTNSLNLVVTPDHSDQFVQIDPQQLQIEEQKRLIASSERPRFRLQRYELRRKPHCEEPLDSHSFFEKAENFQGRAGESSKTPNSILRRRKPKQRSRYTQNQGKEKEEFLLSGWETPEQVIPDDLLCE